MSEEANEPAYPSVTDYRGDQIFNLGLTKREYFAAMAMQGLLSGGECVYAQASQAGEVSRYAVQQADALLAELERTK